MGKSKRVQGIRTDAKRGATRKEREKLSVQQETFILHLLNDPAFSAEEAARKAGYTGAGSGAKLLRNPIIAKELSFRIAKRNEALSVKAEDVIGELKSMAFRDILDLCDEDGKINLTDMRKLPQNIRKCIDGLKVKTGYDMDGNQVMTVDLKLVPKIEAMQLLMKHLGMLEPDGMRKLSNGTESQTKFDWDELYVAPAITNDPVALRLEQARKEAEEYESGTR